MAEGVEAVEVLGQREVVGVGGVGFDAGEDGVWSYEAGDVVDVAVGVVAGAAAVEPERLMDAEVVVEGAFELGAGLFRRAEAGVALLDLGEEALLGGEEDAGAVDVDGAAFEDDAAGPGFGVSGRSFGLNLGDVVELGDAVGELVVAAEVGVLGPGVELPVGDGEAGGEIFGGAFRYFYEDGAGIAQPDAVGGPVVEVECGRGLRRRGGGWRRRGAGRRDR